MLDTIGSSAIARNYDVVDPLRCALMEAYLWLGARYSILRSPYRGLPWSTIEIGRRARRLTTKGLCLFKSQQHRARPAKHRELVKSSTRAEESRKFKTWRASFALSASDERGFAKGGNDPVQFVEQDQSRQATLATEEQRVLRCLGAALIAQWNDMPTTLQREIFDTAESVGKLLETAALRGQIARFLHKHKNDAGCNKLSEFARRDARLCDAALSRWDDDGGAVRDGGQSK